MHRVQVFFAGFSQCFTDNNCTGGTVPAATERECCVETNEGLAFSDDGTCTVCIGIQVFVAMGNTTVEVPLGCMYKQYSIRP